MSVHITAELRCDECGGTTSEARREHVDKMTVSDIAALRRYATGWARRRVAATATARAIVRDLCPLCRLNAEAAAKEARARTKVRR